MNVKRYLTIVGIATVLFVLFAAGMLVYDYLYTPFGHGSNTPDGTYDTDVEGIEEIERSKPYNILVLGVDVEANLTDVIMLCQIDTENHKMNMLSVPRDTRITIDGSSTKINTAFHGGIERTIKYVKEVTGLPVHYYFQINTAAFRDTIDALGGVDFDVPQDMRHIDPYQDLYIDLKKGFQHLDGDKAEQLVRFRGYPAGDIARIQVQHEFFAALVEQKLATKYVVKIPKVYDVISKNSTTNMRVADMLSAGKQLLSIDRANYATYTLPGEAQWIGGVSYYIANKEETDALVASVFSGDYSEEQ